MTPTPTPLATAPNAASDAGSHGPAYTAGMIDLIRLTGKGFTLEGANGEVYDNLSFFNRPSQAIDMLEHVLGVEPTPADVPESLNGLPGPAWSFDGLLVIDGGETPFAGWRYTLVATAPTVQGVPVVGLGGLAVGDPVADYASILGGDARYIEGYGTYADASEPPYSWASANITYFAEGTSTTFTRIIAPTGA